MNQYRRPGKFAILRLLVFWSSAVNWSRFSLLEIATLQCKDGGGITAETLYYHFEVVNNRPCGVQPKKYRSACKNLRNLHARACIRGIAIIFSETKIKKKVTRSRQIIKSFVKS